MQIKILVAVSFLLLSPKPSSAAIMKIKDLGTASAASGTSVSITVPAGGVAAGHTVIFAFITNPAYGGLVEDTRGNAYNVDGQGGGNPNGNLTIYSATITTPLQAGDHVTLTISAAVSIVASATEFSGLAVAPHDQVTAWAGSTSAVNSGNVTTTVASELLVGVVKTVGASTSFTPGSGYAALGGGSVPFAMGSSFTLIPEFRIISSTGTYVADGTLGGDQAWFAFIVTYKAYDCTADTQGPGVTAPTAVVVAQSRCQ